MAGLSKTCPQDFLHLETGTEPIKSRFEKMDMLTWDRYARLPEDDSRRKILDKVIPPRLKTRVGWRWKTAKLMDRMSHKRAPRGRQSPPWTRPNIKLEAVQLEKKKTEYSEEELNRRAVAKIDELKKEVEIYTDGSTSGDQENGGAGVFIRTVDGEILAEYASPAGALCSSYTAEGIAFSKALDWLLANQDRECLIVSDSMSLFSALKSNNWRDTDPVLAEIKEKLRKIQKTPTLLWVPSHCKIEGNDKADELADLGTKSNQTDVPVTSKIIKAKIKGRRWKVKHERAIQINKNRRQPRMEVEAKWPKSVRSLYARLCTGHSKELNYYKWRIEKTD